jgi:hypothetical protein
LLSSAEGFFRFAFERVSGVGGAAFASAVCEGRLRPFDDV